MMSDDNVEEAKTVAFGTAKSVRGFFFCFFVFFGPHGRPRNKGRCWFGQKCWGKPFGNSTVLSASEA